jgi:mono/diheme cytochrome c family protein
MTPLHSEVGGHPAARERRPLRSSGWREYCRRSPAPGDRALLDYQLSLRPPRAARRSLDEAAVRRGRRLFRNDAQCATCHQGPAFTDVLSGTDRNVPFLHDPAETGMDPAYATRSATGKYRTTPLRGLLQHPPYFHDGSAPDLLAVVNHYDALFGLNLTSAQKSDLVEYLKSL